MPQNWKTYKLGDVAVLNKKNINPKNFNDEIYIGLEHIGKGSFLIESTGSASDVTSNKAIFASGDILYGKIRPYFKKVYRPKFSGICSTDILVIGPRNESNVTQDYLYQLIRTQEFTDRATETSTGTKMPRADWNSLTKLNYSFPPLSEQKAIVSILSALDDKIELNLQQNKTLEEMAMALYKHWFVDFGPFQDGEFVDSELGMIPKGWEVKSIGELIETLGGGTPKTKVIEYWQNGDIDWYSPTDLTSANSLYSLGTAKKITKLGLQKSSAKLFPKNSLLMSSRATIGAITINRKEACTNQGFITMLPNDKLSLYQLHGWTVFNMDVIISKANGSTFKEISKTNFRNLPIALGIKIQDYLTEVSNYYSLIESNILENQTLTQLRDTLLPKLISGEVRLKEFEKTAEAAL
ncbi:restriction endonuclease subunit S [Pukyongia salina]|uniref:Restriction endonuclease subunit S n=1 Tax=Pukyongia salina TaxID=2094025 RepID=A0A2S0HW65_9FLAO|nr:restriction endonuclease subunit S [Pukyongia salina]AVI50931.1 restriction endonuclease subunit S [Pukyongia salina]